MDESCQGFRNGRAATSGHMEHAEHLTICSHSKNQKLKGIYARSETATCPLTSPDPTVAGWCRELELTSGNQGGVRGPESALGCDLDCRIIVARFEKLIQTAVHYSRSLYKSWFCFQACKKCFWATPRTPQEEQCPVAERLPHLLSARYQGRNYFHTGHESWRDLNTESERIWLQRNDTRPLRG
jgi:hypothetical protein